LRDDLRLADMLAALSVATDLGMGQEPEKAVRACLVATQLAQAMELPSPDVQDVFYTALLKHLGCTAPSHEVAYLLGDDLAGAPQTERTDMANRREALALMAAVGKGTGAHRIRYLVRTLAAGKEGGRTISRAVCEVGALMAERLRLSDGVRTGLFHSLERWDGRGDAHGLAGDDVALPARLTAVATQAVIFDRLGGPDAAVDMVRRRLVRPRRGRDVRARRAGAAAAAGRGGRVDRGAGGRAGARSPDPPDAARRRGSSLRRHGRSHDAVHAWPLGRGRGARRGGRWIPAAPRRRR
jgi:hypothetical protein